MRSTNRRFRFRTHPGPALVAVLALLALPALGGEASAQRLPADAVPIVERVDPVTKTLREVVRTPLPAGAVRAIQDALDHRHAPLAATGRLDRGTRAALRAFQAERGLRISGQPDVETVRALGIPLVRVSDTAPPASGIIRRAPTLVVIGPDAKVARPRDPAPIGVDPAGSRPPPPAVSDVPAPPAADPDSPSAPATPGAPAGSTPRAGARPRLARHTPTSLRRSRCRSSSS